MDPKYVSIKETLKSLIEIATSGVEQTRSAASLIKDASVQKALLDACDHFQKTFDPLTNYVDARVANLIGLENAALKRKERIAQTSSRIKEKIENLKKNQDLLAKKLKSLPPAKIKSLKKIKAKKPAIPEPKLLLPQQLLEQIGIKILSPSRVPRPTGNIWENWDKKHPESLPNSEDSQRNKEDTP